jgi:hypothetical protein
MQNHVLPELENLVHLAGLAISFVHVPLVEREVARGMVSRLRMQRLEKMV